MIALEWRDVALGDGPAISTSLTLAETDELRRLAKGKWPEHLASCSLVTTHHLTCTCGAHSRPLVSDVLEVGSAYGYSAIAMALAGARVVAVDPHQWLNSHGIMLANLGAYAVHSRVNIRTEDSRAALPAMVEAGKGFDLVWIDGAHEADVVAQDVAWGRKLLRTGGTLAVHDYDEATCPGVREALDAWKVPPRLVDTLAVYGPGEW